MSTLNGLDDPYGTRTLDGLVTITADVIDATTITVDGVELDLAGLFDKTKDSSDDILQGVAQLFMTAAEKALLHAPVTLGTSTNGLSLAGQQLSLGLATTATAGALSTTDKASLDANTLARHSAVTLGTATNGLSLAGQTLSMGLAGLFAPGAISAATYLDITVAKTASHPRLTLSPGGANGLTLDASNQILGLSTASATVTGALSSSDFAAFAAKQGAISVSTPIVKYGDLLTLQICNSGQDGFLRSIDYNTFAAKQNAITAGTGLTLTGATLALAPFTQLAAMATVPSGTAGSAVTAMSLQATLVGAGPMGTDVVSNVLQIQADGSVSGTAKTALSGPWAVSGSTINYTGNVGIKNATPYNALAVNGNVDLGQYLDNFGSRYVGIRIANATPSYFLAGMEIQNTTVGGSYSQKVHFMTHTYGGSYGRRVTISEGGYLGVGTESPDFVLDVVKNIDAEVTCRLKNDSAGASGVSALRLTTSGSSDGIIFKNNSVRTADGGANTMTMRNDGGELRLMGSGGGMRVATDGSVYHENANNSFSLYGPNSSGARLRVGASGSTVDGLTAQVFASNGNLHLDCAKNPDLHTYINYHSNLVTDDNDMYLCNRKTFMFNVPLSRQYESPQPIRHLFANIRYITPVYYPGPTWTQMTIFDLGVQPLRTSSRFYLRANLSVAWYGTSSIGFRFTRNGSPIYVGTGGVHQGNARTAPISVNDAYWMPPPCTFEVVDDPGTTGYIVYGIQMLTYSTAGYGFRLNYPSVGGSGGDATGVCSTFSIQETAFAELFNLT